MMNMPAHRKTDDTPSAEADEHELAYYLSQLESCLETPVVPGEMASWAAAIQQSCEATTRALRHEIDEHHPSQFSQISRADPELLQQVEQLRAEDAQLRQEHESLCGQVHRFCERADAAEPQESKLDEQVSALVDDGIALLIRIRKQQQAITTWLLEAHQRDTGIGD